MIILRYDPKIITLQEAHISPQLLTSYPLNQFKWHDKKSNISHHNIFTGIHNSFQSKLLSINSHLPILGVQITKPINLNIINMYLSRNNINNSDLDTLFQEITNSVTQPLLTIGDWNAQHTNWGCKSSNSRGSKLEKIFEFNNLHTIHHKFPTPSTGSESSIDQCAISSSHYQHYKLSSLPDLHGSDHFPLLIKTSSIPQTPPLRPRWKVEEANWKEYKSFLATLPWDSPSLLSC